MSADAYAAHIFARIGADIDFLESSGHLRSADAATIRQALAQSSSVTPAGNTPANGTGATSAALSALSSRAGAVTSRFAQLAVNKRSAPSPPSPAAAAPPAHERAPAAEPQQELARAIWAYSAAPGATDELSFNEGDTLVVVEHTSADWWKGYVLARPSEPKLYPSNYVEAIAVAAPSPAAGRNLPPAYAHTGASTPSEKQESGAYTATGRLIPKARFSSGGPAVPPARPSPQAEAGPSTYNANNGPAGLTPVMTDDQKSKKKDGMKKLGGTMAHGAAGGVGFGVGVGLVNALF